MAISSKDASPLRVEVDLDRLTRFGIPMLVMLFAGYMLANLGPRTAGARGLPGGAATPTNAFVGDFGPGVSFEDYCRQVALSQLISGYHEITDEEVRFIRDPSQPGNAVQQFATNFGEAILSRVGPTLMPSAAFDARTTAVWGNEPGRAPGDPTGEADGPTRWGS